MKLPSLRMTYALSFVAVLIIFGVTLFLQFKMDLSPCPLCDMERIILLGIGLVYFVALLHHTKMRWLQFVYPLLALLVSVLGMITAGRHVWIQWYPPENASCGAGLNYLLQCLPVQDVIRQVFEGSAECTQVSCSFGGVTLTEWSFVAFVVFFVISLWQLVRPKS